MQILQKEIEELEKGKQDAINSYKRDGKYLVIAGPGTGKTFTVTKRIEAILKDKENGTDAERILCLTFSDAAAREMRLGLEKNHVADSAAVNIFTFHSFCMSLMETHSELFDLDNKSLITSIQNQAIIKECIDELEKKSENERIKVLRTENNLYGKISEIADGIKAIKHNRLTPEKIKKNLDENTAWRPLLQEFDNEEKKQKHQDKINEIEELLRIYDLYIKKTKEYIDFDDMINDVLDEFERNPNFLEEVASQYDYVHVDEYQDTNKSQNDIVFNLASHCKNIFVVGDDDQIIYAFQGASLDTIKNFKEKFNAEVFNLEQNRRSTQTILSVAEELATLQDNYIKRYIEVVKPKKEIKEAIANKPFKFRFKEKHLMAFNEKLKEKNKPVKIEFFQNEKQELLYITNKIKEITKNNCPTDKQGEKLYSEIAVLTKNNDEAYTYANRLKEMGIRVQLSGGKNIFEMNSVKVMIAYMQFLSNPEQNQDKLYKYLLYKPFHIHARDYKILHSKEIKDCSNSLIKRIEQAIIISDNEQSKSEHKNNNKILSDRNKLQNFLDTYNVLTHYITSESIKNSIIQIANKTGVLKCYLGIEINRMENYDALNRLVDEAKRYEESHSQATFKEFVSYINTLIDGGIEVKTDKADRPYNAVQIMTLHSSKGREFEYVFMPSLNSNKYESNNKSDGKETIPLEKKEIKVPDETVSNIAKIDDLNRQIKFLNSAKLIYVGMTRAKHYLEISAINRSYSKPSWFITTLMNNLESQGRNNLFEFEDLSDWQDTGNCNNSYEKELNNAIKEIEKIKEHIDNDYKDIFDKEFEKIKQLKNVLEFTATPDEAIILDYNYKEEFQDYIIDNIPEKHSVSSINTYLKCPKKYFYQYVMHLAPEREWEDEEQTGENYADWGTIIHYAIENYVREVIAYKSHKDFAIMEKYFDEKQQELLESANKNTIKDKKERLKVFHNVLQKTPAECFFQVEKDIPDEKEEGKKYIDISGIKFSGKIDRIDKFSENTYSIFDYKTGTGKSKVKDKAAPNKDYESIYNQLAFYKYVLETQYNRKVKAVGIIFPEEPESSFTIQDLEGENGLENAKLLIEKYVKTVKEDIEQEHNFECCEKCNKKFCDFADFCDSKVI